MENKFIISRNTIKKIANEIGNEISFEAFIRDPMLANLCKLHVLLGAELAMLRLIRKGYLDLDMEDENVH